MLNRIMGVIRLDINIYEEIEHDENATMEAAMIVFAVALVAAIGGYLSSLWAGNALGNISAIEGFEEFGSQLETVVAGMSPIGNALSTFIGTFVTWILWSYITYFVGTRMFNGVATPGEMLRVIGYSLAPRILSFIPCVNVLTLIWTLVMGFVGIRQGLDLDNGKTTISILISLVGVIIGTIVVNGLLRFIF